MSVESIDSSFRIFVQVNKKIDNVVERYVDTAKKIIKAVEHRLDELPQLNRPLVYWIERTCVMEDVKPDVLDSIPTNVGNYRIKSVVANHCLWITTINTGNPHGAGVVNISSQAVTWKTCSNYFAIRTDARNTFGEGLTGAPDLIVSVKKHYSRPEHLKSI